MGLLGLYHCVGQFPQKIYLFVSIHITPVLFPWRTLTDTDGTELMNFPKLLFSSTC